LPWYHSQGAAQGGGDVGHAAAPQQVERGLGQVATGSAMGWGTARADLTGILAQRHSAPSVPAVRDLPVAAPELLQPGGIRLLRGRAGRSSTHSARVVPT
jgi:hypothetical protein